jgi:integrase/recombinase XerD
VAGGKQMNRDELIKEYIDREKQRGLAENTVKVKETTLKRFYSFLDEAKEWKGLARVTEEDIEEFIKEGLLEKRTGKEHNRRLGILKNFYDYLIQKGAVLKNPAEELRSLKIERVKKPPVFSEEEIKQILKAVPKTPVGTRDRAMFETFYSTGIRKSELINLNMEDIDPDEREITVREGKGSKDRVVPIREEALRSLREYIKIRYRFMMPAQEREALFLSTLGRRIGLTAVDSVMQKLKKRAGLEKQGSCHALRHACASHLLKNGAPIETIQKLLGHEHVNTTQDYLKVKVDKLKEVHKESHPGGK